MQPLNITMIILNIGTHFFKVSHPTTTTTPRAILDSSRLPSFTFPEHVSTTSSALPFEIELAALRARLNLQVAEQDKAALECRIGLGIRERGDAYVRNILDMPVQLKDHCELRQECERLDIAREVGKRMLYELDENIEWGRKMGQDLKKVQQCEKVDGKDEL
jgi:hypothetical protein